MSEHKIVDLRHFASAAASRPLPGQDIHSGNRQLRTEIVLRFGNYFCSAGWQTCAPPRVCRFRYEFAGLQPWEPEFSFSSPLQGSYRPQGQPFRETGPLGGHFVHLFWLRDGHKLEVDAVAPLALGLLLPKSRPDRPSIRTEIAALRDWDSAYLLHVLEEIGDPAVWQNRMVLEMVSELNSEEQLAFRHRISSTAPNGTGPRQDMDDRVPFGPVRGLRGAIPAVSGHVEPDRASLSENASQQGHQAAPGTLTTPEQLRAALALLREQSATEEMCRVTLDFIRARRPTRRQMAAMVLDLFPRNVKWWLKTVMESEHLGEEQAAEALSVVGASSHAHHEHELARFCFALAAHIDPESQSAAWNLGLASMETGDSEAAAAAFASVVRHYSHHSLSMRWPSRQGLAWPMRSFPATGFALPRSVANWPRITVITPSLNHRPYLEETLLSVLNQCYPNLQYIVVDGGSTDGSAEILRRYRDRLDVLIVEPDEGQAQAINKGLRLADGDIIGWLNSDDIYAPGALHSAALAWLTSGDDVVAGICAEHTARRIRLVNKPLAGPGDFNIEQLGLIFERWFQGWFFHQPEVFFRRSLLDEVGMLDETLEYAMDYDLWMRFAQAGATVSVVDWPFAFFRKHADQKTNQFTRCLAEQARVRNRYAKPVAEEGVAAGIAARVRRLQRPRSVQVAEFGDPLSAADRAYLWKSLYSLLGAGKAIEMSPVAEADIVVWTLGLCGSKTQHAWTEVIDPGKLNIAWFGHQPDDPFAAYDLALATDLLVAREEPPLQYLRGKRNLFLSDLQALLHAKSDGVRGILSA